MCRLAGDVQGVRRRWDGEEVSLHWSRRWKHGGGSVDACLGWCCRKSPRRAGEGECD